MANDRKVGNLIVQMRAELGQLRTDVKEIERTFSSGFTSIGNAAKNLGSAIAAGLSVGALVAFGKSLVDLGDKLSDLSDQTGLSVETLGGIRTIAEQNGTSLDAFATGVLKAQRNLGEMTQDGTGAAQSLKLLSLNVNQLKQLGPDQFLEKVAAALATVDNRNERAAIAAQLFGKAGVELIPTILQIAENGLPKLSKETAEAYRRFGDLKDQWVALKAAGQDLSVTFLGRLAESLQIIPRSVETIERDLLGTLQFAAGDIGKIIKLMNELGEARKRAEAPQEKKPTTLLGIGDAEKTKEAQAALESFITTQRKQIEQLGLQRAQLTLTADDALRAAQAFEVLNLRAELASKKLPIPPDLAARAKEAQGFLESLGFSLDFLSQKDLSKLQESIRTLSGDLAKARLDADLLKQSLDAIEASSPEPLMPGEIIDRLSPGLKAKAGGILSEGEFKDLTSLEKAGADQLRNIEQSISMSLATETQKRILSIKQEFDERIRRIEEWKLAAIQAGMEVSEAEARAAELTGGATSVMNKELNDMGGLAGFLTSSLGNLGSSLANAITSGGDALKNFGVTALQTLTQVIAKLIEMQVLFAFTGGKSGSDIFGGFGGFLGGLLAGFLGLFGEKGGLVPGGLERRSFASGGEIPIIAHAGEFIFRRSAVEGIGIPALRSMNQTGRIPSGGNVYNIDARGAQRGVSAEIRRAIDQSRAQAVKESVTAVGNERQRSNNYARIFK